MISAALILGKDDSLRQWEVSALEQAIRSGLEVKVVAYCQNDRRPRLRTRNFLYYVMATLGRRKMSMMRPVSTEHLWQPVVRRVRFYSIWESNWQRIPESILAEFSEVDVVIRFGMNLIKNPDEVQSPLGILSYHHGDISEYRGRPAGFYEMVDRQVVMGLTVQKLGTKLDGGEVRATGSSAIFPYSYSKTLNNALQMSIPLLTQAIKEGNSQRISQVKVLGEMKYLPTNFDMLKFLSEVLKAKVRRLLYGMFMQKKWRVGVSDKQLIMDSLNLIDGPDLESLPLPRNWAFAADPAGFHLGALLCEAMEAGKSQAKIAAFTDIGWTFLDLGIEGTHVSYPHVVKEDNKNYLCPEISEKRPPALFELSGDSFEIVQSYELKGLENERLFDATICESEGFWFLFASRAEDGNGRLDLWYSENLLGEWFIHPMSPIVVNPSGARMAGPIINVNNEKFRLGQDCTERYGDGIVIHRIKKLNSQEYVEETTGRVDFTELHGPHTMLFASDGSVFLDYYYESFSVAAWWPRIRQRINLRSASS